LECCLKEQSGNPDPRLKIGLAFDKTFRKKFGSNATNVLRRVVGHAGAFFQVLSGHGVKAMINFIGLIRGIIFYSDQ
jgi:hypothetical protein